MSSIPGMMWKPPGSKGVSSDDLPHPYIPFFENNFLISYPEKWKNPRSYNVIYFPVIHFPHSLPLFSKTFPRLKFICFLYFK